MIDNNQNNVITFLNFRDVHIQDVYSLKSFTFKTIDIVMKVTERFDFAYIWTKSERDNPFIAFIPCGKPEEKVIVAKFLKAGTAYTVSEVIEFEDNTNQFLTEDGRYLLIDLGTKKIIIGGDVSKHEVLLEILKDYERVLGGGYFMIDREKKLITLYDTSIDYKAADHLAAAAILQENLPKGLEGYSVKGIPYKA